MANGDTWFEVGFWYPVARWNPMRWFGRTHYRTVYLCGGLGDEPEYTVYGTAAQVAVDMLKEQFGG